MVQQFQNLHLVFRLLEFLIQLTPNLRHISRFVQVLIILNNGSEQHENAGNHLLSLPVNFEEEFFVFPQDGLVLFVAFGELEKSFEALHD